MASGLVLALAWCQTLHAEITPPVPVSKPSVTWPPGHELSNDLLVPVIVVVSAEGEVVDAELEAGIGEPFDTAALAAATELPIVASGSSRDAPHPQIEVVGERAAPVRSASEITRDQEVIRAAPHRTGGDLLQVVPGVFITQHSGQGKAYQVFYRGFDAVHGQDLEFWVGGAPVNEVSNLHGQGYADLHFVMPEVGTKMRVSPGNYSPEQGDFAVAGTIRYDLGFEEPGVTAKGAMVRQRVHLQRWQP